MIAPNLWIKDQENVYARQSPRAIDALHGGNDCTVSLGKGGPGKCIRLSECPSAIDALQAGTYPQPCGFIGIEPVVCCETASALTNSISDQQCIKYSNIFSHFARPVVVGGTDTSAKKFPHTASLGFARGNDKVWQCGGSLISDQFVLTAAHCLQSREFGHISWVRLGEQNLPAQSTFPKDYRLQSGEFGNISWIRLGEQNLPAESTFPNDYQIIERIAHPQYRAPSVYNDIALVKLDRTVTFTRFIKLACLYTNSYIAPDTALIATGWGLTKFAGHPSERLQEVDLNLFSEQECNETYSNMAGTRKLRSGILSDSQVCAGGRTVEKDTCQVRNTFFF
ncbi:snake [Carabus blaptoides fortunei]